MYKFEKSIWINRPQQEVFDYVTDPANDAEWQGTSQGSEWTSESPVETYTPSCQANGERTEE